MILRLVAAAGKEAKQALVELVAQYRLPEQAEELK